MHIDIIFPFEITKQKEGCNSSITWLTLPAVVVPADVMIGASCQVMS